MPSREAAWELEISGLGRHMAVKRAGEEKKEADWSEAGDAICAPSGDAGVPAGHHGGKLCGSSSTGGIRTSRWTTRG